MESGSDKSPLVVIVGETASGKTALAIELAKRFNGEIIAADSRTVYKGLDIGTAKPTMTDRALMPHHLINVVSPKEIFSAADFKRLAQQAIDAIHARHKIPIMVGGTGLYIDSILYDFSFGRAPDMTERSRLQKLSVGELQKVLLTKGIKLPENEKNPRHLIRAIENDGVMQAPRILRSNTVVIGLVITRSELEKRLVARVNAMVRAGLVDELRHLIEQYGWNTPALQSTGYRAFRPYLEGNVSLEEAEEMFVRNDMQLAKRQRTWLKRNKSVHWISKQAEAVDLVTTILNK